MTRVEPVRNEASNRLFEENRSGLAENERQRAQGGWQPWQRSDQGWQRQQDDLPDQGERQHRVTEGERAVALASGAIGAVLGLRRGTLPGLLCAAASGMLIYNGITGRWPEFAQGLLGGGEDGARPREDQQRGIKVQVAMTINRSAEELYRFWRNFENLPRIMTHLESVRVLDDRRSHWVVRAPRVAGGQVEWDAEITRDDPNELIEWRSLPGSAVDTSGQVRFAKGLGDRGTEVHVNMQYTPPGGKLGHLIAALSGENPKRVVREDLRNFKRIMELGEILTIIGQPHGTCTGQGVEYTESEWKPMFT